MASSRRGAARKDARKRGRRARVCVAARDIESSRELKLSFRVARK